MRSAVGHHLAVAEHKVAVGEVAPELAVPRGPRTDDTVARAQTFGCIDGFSQSLQTDCHISIISILEGGNARE